jgi:hypothetical protein
MFQRKYLVFLTALALLALAWAGGWLWLADKLRADIDSFVAAQRENGVVLRWDDLRISGFPVRFDTDIDGPTARWDRVDRTIEWAGADTSIRPFLEGPGAVSFRAAGLHRLELRDPDIDFRVETRSDKLNGILEFDDAGQIRGLRGVAEPFDLHIDNGPRIGVSRAAFDYSRHREPRTADPIHPDPVSERLSVVVSEIDLTDIPLDASIVRALSNTITTFAAQAAIHGPLVIEAVSPESLARWRDAGGTLEVESLEMIWGPLRFAGDGTLALDEALQPAGAFSARISGLDTLIDLLEQRGEIQSRQAAFARIALAVLMRAPGNGGAPEARIPVTIQDRMLSIGPVRLLELKAVNWE